MAALTPTRESLSEADILCEQEILTVWINGTLESDGREAMVTKEGFIDELKDGTVLLNLLQVLTNDPLAEFKKMSKGRLRIQLIANQNNIFKCIESQGVKLKMVGITPSDIVDGKAVIVVGMIWDILEAFTAKSASGPMDPKTFRKDVLQWANTRLSGPSGVGEITALGAFFHDANIMRALLCLFDVPLNESPLVTEGKGQASDEFLGKMMAHAKEAYGMPTIIDDATLAQLKGASPIVQERFAAMCIVGLSNRLQAKFPNPELKVFDSAPAAEEGSAAEDGDDVEDTPLEEIDVAELRARIAELEMENKKLKGILQRAPARASLHPSFSLDPRQSTPDVDLDAVTDAGGNDESVIRMAKEVADLNLQDSGEVNEELKEAVRVAEERADELAKAIVEHEKQKAHEVARAQKLQAQLESLKEEMAAKDKHLGVLELKVRDGDTKRRKLHNQIQELRGNVRVFARIRPYLPMDKAPADVKPTMTVEPDLTTMHLFMKSAKTEDVDIKTFSFDRVFGQPSGQDEVFLEVSEFVQSALDGYNVCLFSYGQTGSGKTHTMQGAPSGEMRGIIPRAIEQVAMYKKQLEEGGWTFEMEISFVEIYCEQIRDLLADPKAGHKPSDYKITKNDFGQCYVTNAEMVPVDPSDTNCIDDLMEHAASQRSVTATKMNASSSRSHSIFTLHLSANHAKQNISLHGQLNLVDLAGSERVEKSGVSGQALTEAKHINTSLSALAGVFHALGNKNSHVPFRDSKLTELLHPALSGNGKTLMMLNLSPIDASASESLSSLRFGSNVNQCELGRAKRVVKSLNGGKSPAKQRGASDRSSVGGGSARGRSRSPDKSNRGSDESRRKSSSSATSRTGRSPTRPQSSRR